MTNPSPIPTQVEAESVDTAEFQSLIDELCGAATDSWACGGDFGTSSKRGAAESALIAHIDSIITARVAAARQEGRRDAHETNVILLNENLKLHRQLAHEKLRADQGWQRYESANKSRQAAENALAASQAAPAKAEGYVLAGYVPESSMDALEVAPHASICCLSRDALPPGPVKQVAVYVAASSTLPTEPK